MQPKPFVKWVGGKRQILDEILKHVPESFNDYYEPFLGGGALFFKLWSEGRIKKAYLNDLNQELMNAYSVIKNKLNELITELEKEKYANEKEAYYKIRQSKPENEIEAAARFIYLNKTAFNGLYRVNSKGEFNVPFGRYKNPKILDEENLLAVHEALKCATLLQKDFEEAVSPASNNDFIYFDPPYQPISKTSSFTNYTKQAFSYEEQRRLRNVFSNLVSKGCKVLLSNSSAKEIYGLYKEYEIMEVSAKRAINCKAEGRGPITELLIKGGIDES